MAVDKSISIFNEFILRLCRISTAIGIRDYSYALQFASVVLEKLGKCEWPRDSADDTESSKSFE